MNKFVRHSSFPYQPGPVPIIYGMGNESETANHCSYTLVQFVNLLWCKGGIENGNETAPFAVALMRYMIASKIYETHLLIPYSGKLTREKAFVV